MYVCRKERVLCDCGCDSNRSSTKQSNGVSLDSIIIITFILMAAIVQ